MKPLGFKHTKTLVPGHQRCGICHPDIKNGGTKRDRRMTKEELAELAKRMIVPIRCGGSWTENGQRYLIFMGSKLTEEQFHGLQNLTEEQLTAKIEEYKTLGIIDIKRPHLLTKNLARRIKSKRAKLEDLIKEYELTETEVEEIQGLINDRKDSI